MAIFGTQRNIDLCVFFLGSGNPNFSFSSIILASEADTVDAHRPVAAIPDSRKRL
ncbi:MAG: hypothetical protein WA435_00315 [Gallionellaceae bacterium]